MKLVELYKSKLQKTIIAFNEDAKIIFLRNSRTASSSIYRKFLEKKIPGFIDNKTNSYLYDKWSKSLTEDSLKEYFIFTSVRNPYERALSMSMYSGLKIVGLSNLLNNYDNLFIKNDFLRNHIEPYNNMTFFNCEKQFDFEIRFENLLDDFKELCKLLNIRHESLERKNFSEHEDYKCYYNDELIKKVNTIFLNDFKFHNYEMSNNA